VEDVLHHSLHAAARCNYDEAVRGECVYMRLSVRLAAALAEAGIGSLAQARAEGAQAVARAIFVGKPDAAFDARYRDGYAAAARAAAQQAATRGQGEGVGR
jgi:hypothetical protein